MRFEFQKQHVFFCYFFFKLVLKTTLEVAMILTIFVFFKVKQLRLEREREKAMRETELEMLQREKEAEHFKTWAEQEDNFHLQQAKLRSVCNNVCICFLALLFCVFVCFTHKCSVLTYLSV